MHRSARFILALVTCAALVTTGALASTATARTTYTTHLFMSQKFPAFHGRLHSSKHFCIAQRKVRVFEKEPGKDKLLGADTTTGSGHWKVPVQLESGVYYSKAPVYGSAALGIQCTAATSKIAVVD